MRGYENLGLHRLHLLFMLRIPMRGYETCTTGSAGSTAAVLRIPMRGYEFIFEHIGCGIRSRLRIPMRGYELLF